MTTPNISPLFTIAIPVYNRADYLRCALRSALDQTLKDVEIVVSDDCSDEDLGSVINEFSGAAIRYSRSNERLGASRNHQRVTSLATGEFIVMLHSDDALLPTFCEKACERLKARPEAGAVYMCIIKATGLDLRDCTQMPEIFFADGNTLASRSELRRFLTVQPSCCAFRRSTFEQLGGYRTDLRLAYDWDIYMRMLTKGGGVCFESSLQTIYRLHAEQSMQKEMLNGLLDVILMYKRRDYATSATTVSDLILTNLSSALRGNQSMATLLHALYESKAYGVLTIGFLGALGLRIKRRLGCSLQTTNPVPHDPETLAVIAQAQELWQRWNENGTNGR